MFSDEDAQFQLRARLVTLLAASTGNVSLAASAHGGYGGKAAYTRAAGDFRADKLRVGMEVAALGFGVQGGYNNGASVILFISVDGKTLTVDRDLLDEVAAGGRSLIVGLPSLRSWENQTFDDAKAQGRPYVDETYIPGPGNQVGCGPQGYLYRNPMYIPRLFIPRGVGIGADSRYGDALNILFAPGTAIALPNHVEPLKVRRDVDPVKGQRQFAVDGYVTTTFEIPLEIWTPNVI